MENSIFRGYEQQSTSDECLLLAVLIFADTAPSVDMDRFIPFFRENVII